MAGKSTERSLTIGPAEVRFVYSRMKSHFYNGDEDSSP